MIAVAATVAPVVRTLMIIIGIAALGDITLTMIGGVTEATGERVHAVGDTGLPNVTVGRTGGTIITVGKMAGMILVEGITPTVPHMVITGEDITSLPRIITAEVPVLGVISPPFLTGRVMRQISHR